MMMCKMIVCLLVVLLLFSTQNTFEMTETLSEVVDQLPSEVVKVEFHSGVKADLGNTLSPGEVKEAPKLDWHADPNAYYTLIMTDPDAPSRQNPTKREWHHWLVVNVKGNNIGSGEVKSEYIGSSPPQGTGLHRYIILVYKQHGKQDFSKVPHLSHKSGSGRANFSAKKFAAEHSLGSLVAYNYFLAQWDGS